MKLLKYIYHEEKRSIDQTYDIDIDIDIDSILTFWWKEGVHGSMWKPNRYWSIITSVCF